MLELEVYTFFNAGGEMYCTFLVSAEFSESLAGLQLMYSNLAV